MPENGQSGEIRVNELFDRAAPRYESNLDRFGCYSPPKMVALLQPFLGKPSRPEPLVLDLGCGTGLIGGLLAGAAPSIRLRGVDLSANMIAEAAKKGVYSDLSVRGALEYLSESEGGYDAVISSGMFQYVPDPVPIFRLIHEKLEDGGIFLFSFDTQSSDRGSLSASHEITPFMHAYSVPLTLACLRETGFVILETIEAVDRKSWNRENSVGIPGAIVLARKEERR